MDTMAVRPDQVSCLQATPAHIEGEESTNHDEAGLIEQLQGGNAEAFEVLFRRYVVRVSRQAMHLLGNEAETEDVVQEVFLTLYEKANTFRGDAALSTWLYRLTTNAALGRLRRRKRHPEISMDEPLPQFSDNGHHLVRPIIDWSQDVERSLATTEMRQLLHQAIEALQPVDKAVLVLSDLEELSNRDIGDMLGLSISAVKARLHRARLFVRGKLATALGDAPAQKTF